MPINTLTLQEAKVSCHVLNFDLHLVKEDISGEIFVYDCRIDALRPLTNSEVISDSTPVLEVFESLSRLEHIFIKRHREISHIVSRADLDTIPVRIWMYGMISLFEIEVKEKINIIVPDWKKCLSAGRIEIAEKLYSLKTNKNEEIPS